MTPLALRIESAPAQRARRFGRAPLAVKLAIAFLGLVALVLIVNGAVDTYLTYNQARRAALEVEGEKARGASERVGAFLSEIQTQLGWTAGAEWGYSKLEQQRYDFIRLLRQAPAITALSYIDGKGREQIAVSRLEPDAIASGKDFSTDPRFTRAVAEKIWFGPVEFRRGSEPYMTIALAHVGKTPGVTVADVNLKLVWDVVSAIHVGSQGFAYVVDDHGRLIAHPDLSLVLRDSDFSKLPQVAEAMKGQGGSAAAAKSFDGAAVLTAFAIEPKTHWAVFVEQPLSEALAAAYATLARAAGLLGLGLLLAAVTGVALARALAAPIRVLQAGAERLGAGDLSQRLDIRTGDEIEALAGGFNRMAERLQESYETLEAKVEARTRDLAESLAQQTATADVLKVISRSAFGLKAVLQALVDSAVRLCASDGVIYLRHGDEFRAEAVYGAESPGYDSKQRSPRRAGRDSVVGRVALSGDVEQIPDNLADPEFKVVDSQRMKMRSLLGVPLIRDGAVEGVFLLGRPEPGLFADRAVELVRTFADQAVIAIENVRLFEEVQARTRDVEESLAQQTATADVLKVISRSVFDLQTVFETLLTTAVKLVGGVGGAIALRDGDKLRFRAGASPQGFLGADFVGRLIEIDRSSAAGRAVETGLTQYIPDADADADFRVVASGSWGRSYLGVPLSRDGKAEGALTVIAERSHAFTPRHIELVQTFADQAVIAIENVRLFAEVQAKTQDLSESLEYQTAISNVLGVISRSPKEVQPVLDTIVATARVLCVAERAVVWGIENDQFKPIAFSGMDSSSIEKIADHRLPTGSESVAGQAASKRHAVQILDATIDTSVGEQQHMLARAGNIHTILAVPLMDEGVATGCLTLSRTVAQRFDDRQVGLLQTFAEQAVIAIKNVRLFEEVQARTRDVEESLAQQTATADVLKVISRSAFDLDTVFQTLVTTAVELCGASSGTLCVKEGEVFRYRGMAGPEASPALQQYLHAHPLVAPGRETIAGRAIVSRRTEAIEDVLSEADYSVPFSANGSTARSLLGVPLIGKAEVLGAIVLARSEPGAFPQRHAEILRTFADQAVIAIENTRLFEEVQARTRDLAEALRMQTATSDALKVISRSAFDIQKVLDTLAASAATLCEAEKACIFLRRGEDYHWVSNFGFSRALVDYAAAHPFQVGGGAATSRVVRDRTTVHIPDVLADAGYQASEYQRLGDYRTMLGVPLLRDGDPLGVFIMTRREVRPFNQRQIELLQTFADQAVIAIENSRLFEEVQARTQDVEEALAQQTATADVLKTISRSAFDLQAVLDTLVASAVRLFGADNGIMYLQRGQAFYVRAAYNKAEFQSIVDRLREQPHRPGRGSVGARVLLTGETHHVPDLHADPDYDLRFRAAAVGRAVLGVPMKRDGSVVGAIVFVRRQAGPYAPRQIDIAQTFADQAVIAIENARLFEEVQDRTRELEQSLSNLRKTQDRLVQSEKLASLGQLTAGIAHEIKNPLNFVNNFASLSRELMEELRETLQRLPDDARGDADDLMGMIDSNLDKVAHHGKRADSIVKNMLLHSREGSGERTRVNVNVMVEEALNLGYHGARAEKPGFNVTIEKALDPDAGEAELYLQEVTRVLLNLISNGFYATDKRRLAEGPGYAPTLTVSTRDLGHNVEIRIRDNGTGIPDEVRAKMFNPFFTTKPAGEGTGLGLSLSHDIVVKQHGGALDVDTAPGAFTEFVITLPREEARA